MRRNAGYMHIHIFTLFYAFCNICHFYSTNHPKTEDMRLHPESGSGGQLGKSFRNDRMPVL